MDADPQWPEAPGVFGARYLAEGEEADPQVAGPVREVVYQLEEAPLREEFIVCFAAGYPDPFSPTPNTLEEASRFAAEHSFDHVAGEPVQPVIKRRLSSAWEAVEPLPQGSGAPAPTQPA
jgi:hypothetical protein